MSPLLSDTESFDKLACQRAVFLLETERYAKSLRNTQKATYARRYAEWRATKDDRLYDECDRGLTLGYMAKQAVRFRLEEIWKEARP